MEDLKTSDKRKAPDKINNEDDNDDEGRDLNQSSMIELKPARKRPRMEMEEDAPAAVVDQENINILSVQTAPGVEDQVVDGSNQILNQVASVDVVESANIIGVDVSLVEGGDCGGEIDVLVKDSQINLEDSQEQLSLPPLENGNGSKEEELEQLGKAKLKPEEEKSDEKQEEDDGSQRSSNNGHNGGGNMKKSPRPGMESSPLSEMDSTPSREVNLSIKAYDPETGKQVYDAGIFRSDFIRLEVFLNQHNKSVAQVSGFNSGYLGDVDSGFSVPQSTGYRKGRWTSSTLGSSIPRESIKTVYSSNGSPDEDELSQKSKKRGKNDPKLASTRLSEDLQYSSGEKTNKKGNNKISNGGSSSSSPPTNGFGILPTTTTPKPTTKRSKSANKSSSTNDISTSTSKKRTTTPSASAVSILNKPRSMSREFSSSRRPSAAGVGSPMAISSSSAVGVEPSPARAVAIVEGAAAKPLTKFEQQVNNEPVDLSVLKHSKTLFTSIATNNPVFARWSDKNYYSGFIKEKGMNDTWIIDFDDATTFAASEAHIIPIKILGVGITGVYCPDMGFFPADATVLGQKFSNDPDIGETVKYAIKLNSGENIGQVLWCTRRMLSIKENDARVLRQEYQPTPKVFKAAEVSLENIIPESSRRRVTTSLTKTSTPTQSLTPKTPRKIVGGAFDASTAAEDSYNESKQQTPKRKPKAKTPRKKSKGNETTNVSALSGGVNRSSRGGSSSMSTSDLSSSSGLDKSWKESPKKTKLKDKSEHQVFSGYQFFLTASGGGDPAAANTGSNSGPQVLYDKDEYRDLIERKGGKIIDTVGQEEGKERTFLVSDNYARTVKYIYSLAASIPCVSHKWVQECISTGKIVAWESYELNAGFSLESNTVVLPHKKKPLEGFEIYITAGTNDLYDYWKPVLTAANAKLLKLKKVKGKLVETGIPKDAQVLVTDNTCSQDILAIAHERMIPVVKPEWLVQSIIAGNRADFFNNEKYRVEIMDNEFSEDDDYSEDDDENQS